MLESGDEAETYDEDARVECRREAEKDMLRWARFCLDLLANRHVADGTARDCGTIPADDSTSPRVRQALDDASVAACERLARILRSDVEPITRDEAI